MCKGGSEMAGLGALPTRAQMTQNFRIVQEFLHSHGFSIKYICWDGVKCGVHLLKSRDLRSISDKKRLRLKSTLSQIQERDIIESSFLSHESTSHPWGKRFARGITFLQCVFVCHGSWCSPRCLGAELQKLRSSAFRQFWMRRFRSSFQRSHLRNHCRILL